MSGEQRGLGKQKDTGPTHVFDATQTTDVFLRFPSGLRRTRSPRAISVFHNVVMLKRAREYQI